MLLSTALLLLVGVALSEAKVYTQTLTVKESNSDHERLPQRFTQHTSFTGDLANPHSFPFIANLFITFPDFVHYCGGTLINRNYILTAAHNLIIGNRNVTKIKVLLGAHNLTQEEPNRIEYDADKFFTADYDKKTEANDIAVIRLSKPVKVSKTIRPICIANNKNDYIGEIATVAGWGATNTPVSPKNKVLMQKKVPILSGKVCREEHGQKYSDDSMMCAGCPDGISDRCVVDSGGPLLLKSSKGDYFVVGIASFRNKCRSPHKPGVYTKVGNFASWINQHAMMTCTDYTR